MLHKTSPLLLAFQDDGKLANPASDLFGFGVANPKGHWTNPGWHTDPEK